MAWVRTAASLITFGFTIYKFFEFEGGHGLPAAASPLVSPRLFAMIMICAGLLVLIFSSFDYRRGLKQLHEEYGVVFPRSVSLVVVAILSVMGLLAFVAALVRA